MKKENQEMRKEYQDMKREYKEMRKENQKMFNQITENQILLTQKLTSSDVTRELEAENIKKQLETTKNTILNCTIFTRKNEDVIQPYVLESMLEKMKLEISKENQEISKENQEFREEFQEIRRENQKMFNQILLSQKLSTADVTHEIKTQIIKKQFEDTKKTENLCKICFEEHDEIYVLCECGHLPFCRDCSNNIISARDQRCPICRENVTNRMRAFL